MRAAILLLSLAALACSKPPEPQRKEPAMTEPRVFDVSKDSKLVLTVTDAPGPLISTASPPPDQDVVRHPFLSATSHAPFEEDALRSLLLRSKSTGEFLESMRGAGYQVLERPPR